MKKTLMPQYGIIAPILTDNGAINEAPRYDKLFTAIYELRFSDGVISANTDCFIVT